jgi:uridine kinase
MNKAVLIGIAGASGSGKTLLAQKIEAHFVSGNVAVVQEDSYYHDLSHIPFSDRALKNFDHPQAFDHELLIDHLEKLKTGSAIAQPVYDYKTHCRLDKVKIINPHPIILLEGILILNDLRLRNLMDIKIFVDTALDICFIRRMKRDIKGRKRTLESIIKQYEQTVRPMYFQYVEPSRDFADIIIPQGGKNRIALDIITSKIQSLIP